jgi:hypothetical protein
MDTRAAEENSISNVPFAFINSFWKRISARTFFRRRRNSVSMRGDWPRTGAYISWVVYFLHHDGVNTRQGELTYEQDGDIADHLTDAGISDMLDKETEYRLQ